MARITVEDCLKRIPNRFQLCLAATYRARMLAQGHTPKVDSDDKATPWVELNRDYAQQWPNITRKGEAPADADEWKGKPDKKALLSPNPGKP